MNDHETLERLLERFVRYAAVGSQSDMAKADSGAFPSTESQKEMARFLKRELETIGLADIVLDDNFYLTALIPASTGLEDKPSFGLSAHYDTAGDAPADNVKPRVHRAWNGKPITLEEGFVLDPAKDPVLAECAGDTIVTSDGTTLLGADDKAGVAGIITLADVLLSNPEIPHGPIEIMFSPDEETGHGMDRVPLDRITSKAFYTIDGGREGELEIECFNAWKVALEFTGISAHLGAARGKMVNAVTMAAQFVASLPAQESPEATDGYYGYYCPLEISGGTEKASVLLFLRDFDLANMEKRLAAVDAIAASIEARFPGGAVIVRKTRQYLNMKQKLDERPEIFGLLKKAYENAGVEIRMSPIRGGTDGSRLTELGIPTPNVFTGARNLHSRTEWVSVNQMFRMVKTLVELAKLWGEQ
jgi:tripeptide aminopeptidase